MCKYAQLKKNVYLQNKPKKNNIMKTNNLHLKIEIKKSVQPSKMYELLFDVKKSIVYKYLLKTSEKDYFKLPYQVQKLSKKARRK